jgi:hypothetical protein
MILKIQKKAKKHILKISVSNLCFKSGVTQLYLTVRQLVVSVFCLEFKTWCFFMLC